MNHFIVEFKQAFSPEFCQQIIEKFNKDARKHPGRTGSGVDTSKKNSSDLAISSMPEWQAIEHQIQQTIRQAVNQYAKAYPHLLVGAVSTQLQTPDGQIREINGADIQQMNDDQRAAIVDRLFQFEPINMQKYEKQTGGYPYWHSEHFPHPTDTSQRSLHRVLLWLIYLNDVADGGETEFLYQQAKLKPQTGSLVLAPCGFTHTHCGHPPLSNEKYVLASWVGFKEANKLYGQ